MSPESRRTAGILLLVVFPSVASGGLYLLSMLASRSPGYLDNPLRQSLFRAGHAHAGILLTLSLVALCYVDQVELPGWLRSFARNAIPLAAILMPAGFFLSVFSPDAQRPNAFLFLVYAGALVLFPGIFDPGNRSAAAEGGVTYPCAPM